MKAGIAFSVLVATVVGKLLGIDTQLEELQYEITLTGRLVGSGILLAVAAFGLTALSLTSPTTRRR